MTASERPSEVCKRCGHAKDDHAGGERAYMIGGFAAQQATPNFCYGTEDCYCPAFVPSEARP